MYVYISGGGLAGAAKPTSTATGIFASTVATTSAGTGILSTTSTVAKRGLGGEDAKATVSGTGTGTGTGKPGYSGTPDLNSYPRNETTTELNYRIYPCRNAVPNKCARPSSTKHTTSISHQMPDKTSKDHQETLKLDIYFIHLAAANHQFLVNKGPCDSCLPYICVMYVPDDRLYY